VRVILGRVALLLGVAIVAGMAWYGANALFGEDDADDDSSSQRDCGAATNREAKTAARAFRMEYGRERWLTGFGVGTTDSAGVEDATPPIEGVGAVLLVTHLPRAKLPELPDCIRDVPVVYVAAGPFVGN
jgi:hypothetical protein